MKKFFRNVGLISAIVAGVVLLVGCGKKLQTTNYEDEKTKTSISFKYPEELECNYSTKPKTCARVLRMLYGYSTSTKLQLI